MVRVLQSRRMKILLISDIHGNYPALAALRERYDMCICLGDLVDYGLQPGPCIDWVQANCRYTVRGNHDHSVAQRVTMHGNNGYRWLTMITRPITLSRTTQRQRAFLSGLPLSQYVTIGNTRYLFVHASPRDPLDEYAPADVGFWEPRLHQVEADIICIGHTHHPFTLKVGRRTVINPGSIGQPRDGDPRASCAVIEDGEIRLVRYEYPIEEMIADVDASPLPEEAKVMLRTVYRTAKLLPAQAMATAKPQFEIG